VPGSFALFWLLIVDVYVFVRLELLGVDLIVLVHLDLGLRMVLLHIGPLALLTSVLSAREVHLVFRC